jgi:thiol-disulfide isomerase/thioredoxin
LKNRDSQTKMEFGSEIQKISGSEIPNNSVVLLYSPTCHFCHEFVPEFNKLPQILKEHGLSCKVCAVDVEQEYNSLRDAGIFFEFVPQLYIKTSQGSLIEYKKARMADSIAQEAAKVLNGGEVPTQIEVATPATAAPTDALLGGAVTPAAALSAGADLEGGKK